MEKLIRIRGLEIFTKILGEGTPIVFLHGGPGGEHRYFLPHLEDFGKSHQLIFYDQRGCGQSRKTNEHASYTIDEEVETLEALRLELGLDKLNIMGESWGSMLGLLYASKYPENVNKLFFTAAVGVKSQGYLEFGRLLEEKLSKVDKVLYEMTLEKFKSGEADVGEIFKIINPYYVHAEENLKHKTPTTSNAVVNGLLGNEIIENYDNHINLKNLTGIPILIAQGASDIITPSMLEELFVHYLPQTQITPIDECGHWSVIEKPRVLMDLMDRFFN